MEPYPDDGEPVHFQKLDLPYEIPARQTITAGTHEDITIINPVEKKCCAILTHLNRIGGEL